jgi:hypothetical protein
VQAADHPWPKPTLDLSLPGNLAFAPRYGLETHHLPYLEPSHSGVAISPMWLHGGGQHHGNQVPPSLEIPPVPETSQLGRRTCAEEFSAPTKEWEKHIAALAEEDSEQAANHPWHKPMLDLLLPGKLAFAPRYGLETHHLLCLEPSHSGVVISPMFEAPAHTQDAGDAAFRKAAGKALHLLSLTFIYGGGFANTISGHKNAPSSRARRPFPYLNWIWCACILALCATVDTFDVT